MAKLPKDVAAFMEKYGVEASELWEVRNGAYAIKHLALERVAAEQGIQTVHLEIKALDQDKGTAAVIVKVKHGELHYMTTGEASPKNNKNAYCLAMAEKRAIDRAILKALRIHGEVYSEEEADDFRRRENPHVTRPADLRESAGPLEYGDHGEPIDNIPFGDPDIRPLPKKDARDIYKRLQDEMRSVTNAVSFRKWMEEIKNEAALLPEDWRAMFRDQCGAHLQFLLRKVA